MISEEIKNAQSIEEVVQIIDNGGTESESPEEVAAKYAYLAVLKKNSQKKDDLETELNGLMEKGALFDYLLALEHAESFLIDTLNKSTAPQGL
ncbi:hypothetical protein [Methylophaga sp.]|uniref:hypothetical protein n=1 Tax=Methylophaga sp. TaxID=2024840 RepID=UPI003F695B36